MHHKVQTLTLRKLRSRTMDNLGSSSHALRLIEDDGAILGVIWLPLDTWKPNFDHCL